MFSSWIMIIMIIAGSWQGGVTVEHIPFSTKGMCEKAKIEITEDFRQKTNKSVLSISCVENVRL